MQCKKVTHWQSVQEYFKIQISPIVLKEKILKSRQCIFFCIELLSSLVRSMVVQLNKLDSS